MKFFFPSKFKDKWNNLNTNFIQLRSSFYQYLNFYNLFNKCCYIFYNIVILNGLVSYQNSYLPKNGISISYSIPFYLLHYRFDYKYQLYQNLYNIKTLIYICISRYLFKPIKLIKIFNNFLNFFFVYFKIKISINVYLYDYEYSLKDFYSTFFNDYIFIELDQLSTLVHFKKKNLNFFLFALKTNEIVCLDYSKYFFYSINHSYIFFRCEFDVYLINMNSYFYLRSLSFLKKIEQFYFFSDTVHNSSNTYSFQKYYQLLNNHSFGLFFSFIFINYRINFITSIQLNKNILLDSNIYIFAFPNLNIYSCDILCSHGVTVSNLLSNIFNYCFFRSLSKMIAKKLILTSIIRSVFYGSNLSYFYLRFLYYQLFNIILYL